MTDREKLIGLMKNAWYSCYDRECHKCEYAGQEGCRLIYTSDHLLAHGVTVREPGYDTGKCRWFECSLCGYGVEDVFLKKDGDYPLEYNFCPNCGAPMTGGGK